MVITDTIKGINSRGLLTPNYIQFVFIYQDDGDLGWVEDGIVLLREQGVNECCFIHLEGPWSEAAFELESKLRLLDCLPAKGEAKNHKFM